MRNRGTRKLPFWGGPHREGITQSLLGKFLVCRERFRLRVIEGMIEPEGFNHRMEYGSMFHEALETWARETRRDLDEPRPVDRKIHGSQESLDAAQAAVRKYAGKLCKRFTGANREICKWSEYCQAHLPVYLRYWAGHKESRNRRAVLQEENFAVPLTLPSGRSILMRGKFDSVWELHKVSSKPLYLQENKVLGNFSPERIGATLPWDLQTGFYLTALIQWQQLLKKIVTQSEGGSQEPREDIYGRQTGRSKSTPPIHPRFVDLDHAHTLLDSPIRGVIYNVIRRPLSERWAIRQRKGGRGNPPETDTAFLQRVMKGIEKDPDKYFYRWKVEIRPPDLKKFQTRILFPILENLCDWWEWITGVPYGKEPEFLPDPWASYHEDHTGTWWDGDRELEDPLPRSTVSGVPGGGIHYQTPFGVYNALYDGRQGDYWEYLTTGRQRTLTPVESLFPELEG